MSHTDFEHLFAINDVWLYPPDGVQQEPVPVVGNDLSGRPIRQGFPTITFTWSFLRQKHMTALFEAYDPANPKVKLTYIDERVGVDRAPDETRSTLTHKWAMMYEPIIGARQIIYYANVAVRFTHITDWSE